MAMEVTLTPSPISAAPALPRPSRRTESRFFSASNKHECDSRHFELYKINLDGSGLEQVTHFGGFTSFPEFSPDGKTLVFCSDRDAKERYEFNIFTAKWAQN
jgi:Tol biopolymer transport system component